VEPSTRATPALPSRLSPSRAKEFDQCPRRFWFGTVQGCTTPPTQATLKGTVFHTVLERLFDLPREERTKDEALGLVAPALRVMREPLVEEGSIPEGSVEAGLRRATGMWRHSLESDPVAMSRALSDARDLDVVIPAGSRAEAALAADTVAVVENYFDAELERPWNFDPTARELHLEADIGGLVLHGFIDRLDRYETSDGVERWVISDYKTGKVPKERYLDEAFFAMKVYALLLSESQGVTAFSLRLLYVGAPKPLADRRVGVDDRLLEATRTKMLRLWESIEQSAQSDVWETRTGPLCGWCHFKAWCPAFGGDPEAAPKSWLDAPGEPA
jgi:putative RecB family exonuclease